ncbi:glycoside hydrolase family 76 protein, partial [Desertihabitans aurantiacus]|uniref:glycoside hydrolase family 76 protein n=1 Tax=Desertihabitans aurantiacus TaxID=2282477 RepID=UPI0018E53DD6
ARADAAAEPAPVPVGEALPPRPTGPASLPRWQAEPPDADRVELVAGQVVCVLTCDGGEAPDVAGDRPVDPVTVAGRTLQLRTSLPDVVGWAVVEKARPGDRVWLERSFDAGATREQTVEPTSAQRRGRVQTPTTNLTDPSQHRRGVVRACLDTGERAACTEWAYRDVCREVCDGADPTGPLRDSAVEPREVGQRRVALRVDATGAGLAEVTRASAGDEVWVERSWDEGVSTRDGRLGRTTVPGGATTASTGVFPAAEPRLKMAGGALRACVRLAATDETGCTGWTRPAVDRAAAAVDALVFDYDPYTAWWPSSWWNSAVAISTVIDYQRQTGDDSYAWMVERTFEVNRVPFPAGEKSTDEIEGNFISRAVDDAGWWGLAWLNAYDLTGDVEYRETAEIIADYLHSFWDTSTCDGGVWWNAERTYKNAVTNGQYVKLTAMLHQRLPGDWQWRDRAVSAWEWYLDSGMVGEDGLVNDGLTDDCANNGQTVWTYNQGLPIGAGVELAEITGDEAHLDTARQLADAAIDSDLLFPGGVLTESCEVGENPCDDNQKQFKGIFLRYLTELDQATGGDYRSVAKRQADTVWEHRDALNRIGISWDGDAAPGRPNVRDWRTQASGLSALLALR